MPFPAPGTNIYCIKARAGIVYTAFAPLRSLCDLISKKASLTTMLLSRMKTILHATLLIAPVLGQIADPLEYVDPLIGSSNGGTGSKDVFSIDDVASC